MIRLHDFNSARFSQPLVVNEEHWLAPAGAPPLPPPGGGEDCCSGLVTCVTSLARAVWECVKELFATLRSCFVGDRRGDLPVDRGAPIEGLNAPGLEDRLIQEINDYRQGWVNESAGANLSRRYLNGNSPDGILKYIAFVTLRRFEYSDYSANYRDHYFDELSRRAKLLTMELLKLEQERNGAPEVDDKARIAGRIRDALREVAHAAATGCDPRKASVTMQQWKMVSGRVEIYEILLQHIQDAKLAIFKRHMSDDNMDRDAWAVHCYNWIYANIGVQFGLCSPKRAEAAGRDGYIRSYSVTRLVQPLQDLHTTGMLEHTFREEFTQKYLSDALLDAINMDEYPQPYLECLQTFNPEIQEDYNKFEEYVETRLGKQGTSYIFKPKAAEFFLNFQDGRRDLAIDWREDVLFWSFIRDRMPISIEDTISDRELDAISFAHLLRLYRAFVR